MTDFKSRPTVLGTNLLLAGDTLGTYGLNGTAATGSWTSATSQNTAVTVSCAGYSTALFSLVQGSTITGGVVTFEADDGSGTYFPVYAVRQTVAPNVLENTYTLVASTNVAWTLNCAGFTNVRMKLSTVITGTATVTARGVASSAVSEPSVAIDSAIPAGSNTIGAVTQASGPWSDNLTQVASGSVSTTGVTGQMKVGIADSLGNSMNSAGNGFLKVTDEPHQLFYDSFDAAPDTTNMWAVTTGNSAVAASVSTGTMSMGTGTTASGYSKLVSIPTFKPTIPGWLVFSDAIALPDAASPTANALRFWGQATLPTTPTTTTPVTDGYGFELGTTGKLFAVVYAGGTRIAVQDLSTSGTSKQPTDTNYHRYVIQIRTDRVYFYIDTIDSAGLVASTSFNSSQSQILPKAFLCVGGSTPPVSNTQIQCTGAVVSDTAKNHFQLADGTYPWRKASVSSSGAMTVNGTVSHAESQIVDGISHVLVFDSKVRNALEEILFVLKDIRAAQLGAEEREYLVD